MEPEILEALVGGIALGSVLSILFIILSLILVGIYIYFAFAWMTIAKKLKYKRPLIALIPFVNISMILQLGGFHWAWVFLFFVPFIGWIALFILILISTWKVFEKRKYPGWLSLTQLVPIIYFVVLGFVAWYKQKK